MGECNVKKFIAAAGAGVLAVSLTSAAFAENLEYSAGQLGGGWYTMSSGIAKIIMEEYPDLNIKVVPGGGTANPSKIQNGKSQMAMGLDIFTFAARNGKGIYKDKPHDKLMMIGQSFSNNYFHFIRGKGEPLDLKGLLTEGKDINMAVTKRGSSDEMTFRYVMEHFGTSYDDLREKRGFKINQGNYSEMASQFKDGQVDYVFFTLGIPGAAAIDMFKGRDAELLSWTDELAQAMQKSYGYGIGKFPTDTYPDTQIGNPQTIIMGTTLMISSDVSEDAVYKITKAICKNQAKLPSVHQSMKAYDCKTAAKAPPAPIHPGAVKYYKEMGYM